MNTTRFYLFLSLTAILMAARAQTDILELWSKVPNRTETNAKEIKEQTDILWIRKVQNPTIEVYLPTKANATGQAVLICPGGGYTGLAYDWEGTDIAKMLNAKGIAGIVLKYRLPDAISFKNAHQAPLMDALQAMRLVRSHAAQWDIQPNQIGIMGFSAGGHLASSVGTHFEEKFLIEEVIDTLSARPDFMILLYPVISMSTTFMHEGSRNSLLGMNPDKASSLYYSNDLQVKTNTPPTFLIHSADDQAVPVENSLMFFSALKEHHVSVEMHIYPIGGHGFALGLKDPQLMKWPELMLDWMSHLNPYNPDGAPH
ncbi:MAG: alpha/beta hydrolase [Flammeovirgaceae bacterium]|jgi:acetyl esterase/lipase|nr:alpha/beta hydrolase [Flammeovirgaceae bacterium]